MGSIIAFDRARKTPEVAKPATNYGRTTPPNIGNYKAAEIIADTLKAAKSCNRAFFEAIRNPDGHPGLRELATEPIHILMVAVNRDNIDQAKVAFRLDKPLGDINSRFCWREPHSDKFQFLTVAHLVRSKLMAEFLTSRGVVFNKRDIDFRLPVEAIAENTQDPELLPYLADRHGVIAPPPRHLNLP